MGCLAQAGQTRLSWLAPGRMAPWSAWPLGSRLQDGGFWGAQASNTEMPFHPSSPRALPSGMRAIATGGPVSLSHPTHQASGPGLQGTGSS